MGAAFPPKFRKSFTKRITDTSSDSPPSKNEISFWREARKKFLTFCAEGAEKIFFESLIISCAGGRQKHGILDPGRRVEQKWLYYFLCRRAAETRDTGSRPARRAEVALLFLVQEGGRNTGYWIPAGA